MQTVTKVSKSTDAKSVFERLKVTKERDISYMQKVILSVIICLKRLIIKPLNLTWLKAKRCGLLGYFFRLFVFLKLFGSAKKYLAVSTSMIWIVMKEEMSNCFLLLDSRCSRHSTLWLTCTAWWHSVSCANWGQPTSTSWQCRHSLTSCLAESTASSSLSIKREPFLIPSAGRKTQLTLEAAPKAVFSCQTEG